MSSSWTLHGGGGVGGGGGRRTRCINLQLWDNSVSSTVQAAAMHTLSELATTFALGFQPTFSAALALKGNADQTFQSRPQDNVSRTEVPQFTEPPEEEVDWFLAFNLPVNRTGS